MAAKTTKQEPKKKYNEVVDEITEAIVSGRFLPGDQLPSEMHLCQEYGVSRITVRKALSIMVAQGLLYSVPGKGSFVQDVVDDDYLFCLDLNNVLVTGYDDVRLVESSVIMPNADLVYNLYISPKDQVVVLKWLLYYNDEPVALDEKYLPYFPGMSLSEQSLQYHDFADLLKERVAVYDIRREFKVSTTRAAGEIADRLKINEGELLWLFDINVYHKNGNPLGWSKVSLLPEKVCLVAEK